MGNDLFSGCQGIFFDYGGTLDSDGGHWLDRFYDIYGRLGLFFDRADIKRAFYHADRACCTDTTVRDLGLRPLMERHISLQFENLGIQNERVYRHVLEMFCTESEKYLSRNVSLLRDMKPHFLLGVVSNFYGNIPVVCKEAGLADVLDLILDSILIGIEKPDPGIFLAALQQWDLPPSKVVFVGDSMERDIIPAHLLGMKTVWLTGPKPGRRPASESVDARIDRLTELQRLLI
jgi:HAD superfamily hydrolase (TIGR01549 family)